MKINSGQLIQQLIDNAISHLHFVEALQNTSDTLLNKKPGEASWSIAQVLQHLNTYSAYYLPLIEQGFTTDSKASAQIFKPGLLGNYFVGMMQPKNGTINRKYKAAAKHQPAVYINSRLALTSYINHQKHFIALLKQSRQHDLSSIRIPVSIAPFIKIKLGDAFRFLVAHQQRHIIQMRNVELIVGPDL